MAFGRIVGGLLVVALNIPPLSAILRMEVESVLDLAFRWRGILRILFVLFGVGLALYGVWEVVQIYSKHRRRNVS